MGINEMGIRHGTTRTVLLIGRWAIKFPSAVEWRLFLQGLLGNLQERQFWTTKWPELCPVLFGCPGGWFLIMRRAIPLTREDYENFKGFDCEDRIVPVEMKLDSFGWIDGKIVAVDYGS